MGPGNSLENPQKALIDDKFEVKTLNSDPADAASPQQDLKTDVAP
jgi:hypothetical protein